MNEYQKRGYLLERFRLFHLSSPQGANVDFHYHEFCKVLLLVRGSGGYFVDGQRYRLQSGDVLLIGSRSIHRPELDSGPYERIILYISPEYLRQESTEDCELLSLFSGEKGHVLRLRDSRKLFRLASELERELEQEDFGREILSSSAILRLLVEIGRGFARSEDPGTGARMPVNPRIREILAYIDAHLAEDLDTQQIADAFFISKYHMMRQFRQETGTTILQYITRKRLLLAKSLMESGMRATEACYRCGFRSYSSFTRAYGHHLGTTPTGRVDSRLREEDFE